MDLLTAGQVANLAEGYVHPPAADDAATGPGVVIDSRQADAGALFVALPGERVDGHDFVAAAAAAGAGAALVTRVLDAPIPQIVVPDSVRGLSALARGLVRRAEPGLCVLGITGSSGKTSTKDLLAQVLEDAGATVSPAGSFNNEIGVPLTACQVDASTRFLVSELGARGIGHIAWLCSIVRPRVGVVLNVGHAHLGEFGDVATIARAKGELVESLPADGWAVLNADDAHVSAMAGRTAAKVALFSSRGRPAAAADRLVWADDVTADDLQRHSFTLWTASGPSVAGPAPVSLRVLGQHAVANALAAAAAALCADVALPAVAASLSAAEPRSRWRMEIVERRDGVAILNDSYNANPDSMAAALDTLAQVGRARRRTHPRARTVAVLGDMLELGATAAAEHRTIGALAAILGVDEVVGVGEFGPELVAGAAEGTTRGQAVGAKSDVAGYLAGRLNPGDVVLVKASRGLALNTVADDLLAAG